MSEHDSYPHGFRLDRTIRLATDSVINHVMRPEYNPTPPPSPGFFLELNGGHMLFLNGQDWTLL
jgi:hypothetical protein